MSRSGRSTRVAVVAGSLLLGIACFPADVFANSFACCRPDGACSIQLPFDCEALGGVTLATGSCEHVDCHPSPAPVLSFAALVILCAGVLTVALRRLWRRPTLRQ